MEMVYKIKDSVDLVVKDVDMGSRTLVQAYTKYDVKDSDGDFGRKGMFNKTWSENFTRVKHLLNHNSTQPVGKIEKLWDDNEYAFYKSKIGTHTLGEDFIKMADSGLITEASYGFQTIRQNKIKDGNELLEVKLWEVSALTAWGANQYTPLISLTKGLTKEEQINKFYERIKAVEKFCKNSTATDETIELLLIELKQMQQLYIDQISTQAAEKAPAPEVKEDNSLLIEKIKSINQILNPQ